MDGQKGRDNVKIYKRNLPRGIAAVYFEGVGVVVNARLSSTRRRSARSILLHKRGTAFQFVRISRSRG